MKNQSYQAYRKNINKSHELKHEIGKYLKYWPLMLGFLIISVSIVFVKLRYTKKEYQSNAKIKILSNSKGLELPQAGFIFSRPNINLENNIEIIRSSKIWEELVVNLDLATTFQLYGNVLLTEIASLPLQYDLIVDARSVQFKQSFKIEIREDGLFIYEGESTDAIKFNDYNTQLKNHALPFNLKPINLQSIKDNIGVSYSIVITPVSEMANLLRQQFDVTVVGKNSDLLQLSFKGEIKSKSEKILNELMSVFESDGIRLRQEISERTINFIQERFVVLAEELDSIEVGIKNYKVNNKMLSLQEKATTGMTKLSLSEQAIVDLEAQFLVFDFIKNNIQYPLDNLEILPNFMNDESFEVNSQIQEYNRLVFELDRLKTSAGANNPKYKLLLNDLDGVKQNLLLSLKFLEVQLKSQEKELLKKNKSFQSEISAIPDKEKYMRNIERQQRIKETLYLFLLQKREEAAINKAITEPTMQVVEYASSYWDPISPNSKNSYIMALLLGLGIPIVMIYIMMFFDTKIRSLNDIKVILSDLPILGDLHFLRKIDMPTLLNNNSPIVEAFRLLSANLNFLFIDKEQVEGHVILCTSSIKGEGKTFVSVNLARVEANMGRRVLLIGADLRNPQIHKTLNFSNDNLGLSNLLADASLNWRSAIQSSEDFGNLHFVVAGPVPPNAPQLIKNGRLQEILNEAKNEYDLIILDTAPTLLVTDTFLMSDYSDLTIFVARYGYTDKALLQFIGDVKDDNKIKNMAIVLNGIKQNSSYGYQYGYNYGYGYGYSNKGVTQ